MHCIAFMLRGLLASVASGLFGLLLAMMQPAYARLSPEQYEAAKYAYLARQPLLVQQVVQGQESAAVESVQTGADPAVLVSEYELKWRLLPRRQLYYIGGEPERNIPLLVLVAASDQADLLRAVLAANPALAWQTDAEGNTLLQWAARQGATRCVELLLQYGLAPLDVNPSTRHSAFDWAARGEHLATLQALLLHVDATRKRSSRVSYWLTAGSEALAKLLLAGGVPAAQAVDHFGLTPLARAVLDLDEARVALLLAHGARHDDGYRWQGKSLLQYLAQFDTPVAARIARMLQPAGVSKAS
jgi:hypothetical protein